MKTLREIVRKLEQEVNETNLGSPFFSHDQYISHPLSKKNIKPLKKIDSERKIAFLDGGNQEIVGAPNFSIQINRIFFCIFDGDRRIKPKNIPDRVEFISATYAVFRDGQVHYDSIIEPVRDGHASYLPRESDLSFNSVDRSLMQGNLRGNISRVASLARRFAEWEFSHHLIENELNEGDVYVADGTLQTGFPNESKYLDQIFSSGKKTGVIVTGLSKTCSLFTDTGLALMGAIRQLVEESKIMASTWTYHPVVDIFNPQHKASFHVVKLNSESDRIYRYEIFLDQAKSLSENDLGEILSKLSENSRDVAFPGYPYGLIVADEHARVRENELEKYRMMLLSEMSKSGSWNKFKKYIRAIDAHDVLDMLAGV
ncbi:MAG: DNA double-strand break repair nuclease NurA [Candidatus Thorarchaeota archaeon]